MPLGVGRGQNIGLRDFYHSLTLLLPGTSVFHKANKKNMCVYCHMLKKIRVGRSEIIFFFLNFIFYI